MCESLPAPTIVSSSTTGSRSQLFRLSLRRHGDVSAEVDDEIGFHLQERVDALIARGWNEADAAVEARRLFVDFETVHPTLVAAATLRNRRLDWFDHLDSIIADLTLAARQLRRAPSYRLAVLLSGLASCQAVHVR